MADSGKFDGNCPASPVIAASYFGIEVPAGPHLGPGMIRAMQEGRYEAGEVRTALASIRPGERVLELGAGSGAVGAAIARNCRPSAMLSFEANPQLLPHARALYRHNGLDGVITLRHGVVLAEPDAPDRIDFHLRANFLGSGLDVAEGARGVETVAVPVMRYDRLREEFPHDVIVMDIEGGERGLLAHADLAGVRLVLLELHREIYGREGMRDCRRALARQGFVEATEVSCRGVFAYRRQEPAAPARGAVLPQEARDAPEAPARGRAGGAVPPRAADTPPRVAAAAEAVGLDAFLLPGGLCDAWFERRSDVLLVTFDNLATVAEQDPPQPWLRVRAERAGVSLLGLIAHRKDWYRNDDAPALLGALRDAGFFDRFRRVVFAGASMGGFAALTFAPFAPGCTVLAFSPQTSLAPEVVPFERRFPYGRRKWDWSSPAFRDAAEGAAAAAEIWAVYDPFVPEDRAHVLRLAHLPGLRELRCGHFGHRTIRQIKECGALDALIDGIARGDFDEAAFRRGLRARRGLRRWRRTLLGTLRARGREGLARRAEAAYAALATARAAPPGTDGDAE